MLELLRIIAFIAVAFSTYAGLADYYCWRVSDGDTIWVVDERGEKTKIRMNRIDAPEMNQPYGKEAADRLAELVLGKYVELKTSGHDKYGRALDVVYVQTPEGRLDVNLQLVKEGLAWQYYTDKTPDYTRALMHAKAKRLGLWAAPHAKTINPYKWRKENHPPAPDAEYNKRVVPIPGNTAHNQSNRVVAQEDEDEPATEFPAFSQVEYRPGGALPVSSRTAAPVNDTWPETGYWLSTNSMKRHNKNCENYRKTRGYPCKKNDGSPCGKCGG